MADPAAVDDWTVVHLVMVELSRRGGMTRYSADQIAEARSIATDLLSALGADPRSIDRDAASIDSPPLDRLTGVGLDRSTEDGPRSPCT
ncbi:hypothetical protein ACIBKY_35605 [Nonomuraea sp. NPDC050394]|uniref:hypothetical protein n=1 Tax=Nonomuraea sp. NPDC050394 TaxID=3364363 RepID=UPI0037972E09